MAFSCMTGALELRSGLRPQKPAAQKCTQVPIGNPVLTHGTSHKQNKRGYHRNPRALASLLSRSAHPINKTPSPSEPPIIYQFPPKTPRTTHSLINNRSQLKGSLNTSHSQRVDKQNKLSPCGTRPIGSLFSPHLPQKKIHYTSGVLINKTNVIPIGIELYFQHPL